MSGIYPILQLNKLIKDNTGVEINGTSMSASITGEVLDLSETIGFCLQADWSGAPVGNIITEGSLNGTSFFQIESKPTGGAAGTHGLNFERAHFPFLRIRFDRSSGTGALTLKISAKRL